MRILAIRGRNLASLARSFAVELASAPLADVGLFAITGPVGAGKSTLLDALCLALFDRTPRLRGLGGALIGDAGQDAGDWLRASDPRTLLRRDAVEGDAEVDFVGCDGIAYRSRWSVRRARRKTDGRIQSQEMSLTDLRRDLVIASGRRSEVLAAVRQRLGLDFDQFCRSVLLAQGEFDAFLHAAAGERAKLLETLTGASIYRRLSRAAHEKRREYELRAAKLRAQYEASVVLADDVRKRLEEEAAKLAHQIEICDIGIKYAQAYVLWHRQAEKLQRAESDATVALRAAGEAHDAAEPRRQALQARQRALAVVPRWEVAQEAHARAADAQREVESAVTRVAGADRQVRERDQRLRAVLHERLGDETEVPAIASELPKFSATLERWQGIEHEQRDVEQRVPALRQERERAAVRVAGFERQAEQLEAVRAEAAAQLVRAEQDLAEADFDALHERRNGLATSAKAVAAIASAHADLRHAHDEAVQQRARLDEARTDVVARRGSCRAFEVSERELGRELRAARSELQAAERQRGLEALRAQLVDGEACPLCGSEHHPHGVAGGHVAPDVQAVRDTVQAREREHELARQQLATGRASLERVQADVRDRERACELADERRRLAEQRFAQVSAGEPAFEHVDAWLVERRAQLEWEEGQLAALERDAANRAKVQRAAREAVQQGERSQREIASQLRAAEKAERAADDELRQAERSGERLAAAVTEVRGLLEPHCDGLPRGVQTIEALGDARLSVLGAVHDAVEARVVARAAQARSREHHTQVVAEHQRLRRESEVAEEALRSALQVHGVTEHDVGVAQRLGADALADEAAALQALVDECKRCRTELQLRSRQRREHEDAERPTLDAADAEQALEDAQREKQRLVDLQVDKRAALVRDDDALRHRGELAPRLARADEELATWSALDDLIGSSAGDAFAVYAQGLTLDLLLLEANRRLEELARRYRLDRNTGGSGNAAELDFVVVDLDMGGARRSLHSLSGGETFLVSLALALALATLAAPRSRVETLFLDEGFGTLDAHNLEIALGALDSLQATGCQVGVISHVDGIAERIGAVVEVQPEGSGQSRVVARGS